MNFGLNSNVKVADVVYHVQTEDHPSRHPPFVETTVYRQGQVVHRRTTTYPQVGAENPANQAVLAGLIESQHRRVIEELRAGRLQLPPVPISKVIPPTPPTLAQTPGEGLKVHLVNPASWLMGGQTSLQIEVRRSTTQSPLAGADVEVVVEGALMATGFKLRTDAQGRAEVHFPMPTLGPDGGTLVIRAAGATGHDELRYRIRPKSSVPAPHVPPK